MGARLVWTLRAVADLARLHRFLAERNPEAARWAVRAIREGMRLLEAHPEASRPAQGMDPEFRERWTSFGGGGCLALYRLDGSPVMVLAVRHGREPGGLRIDPYPVRGSVIAASFASTAVWWRCR